MQKIYVYLSEEAYLLNKAALDFIKENHFSNFNTIKYDFLDSFPLDILNELQTVSLLDDEKLVIMSNPEFLKPTYKDTYVKEQFINYFKLKEKDSTLLILADFNLDMSLEINRVLEQNAIIKRLSNIDDLSEWVKDYLNDNGVLIEESALNVLLERTDNNMLQLTNELEKLMLYIDCNKITLADVIKLVSRPLDDNIYDLLGAFIDNDKKKLMTIYNDLMLLNEDEMRIIYAISTKLEEILYTKTLIIQGLSKDDIASYLRVKPGRAYYMIKNAKAFSDGNLIRLIDLITKLEEDIKTGRIDKKLGLELFILGKS